MRFKSKGKSQGRAERLARVAIQNHDRGHFLWGREAGRGVARRPQACHLQGRQHLQTQLDAGAEETGVSDVYLD